MRLAAGALTHVSCAQHTSSGARGRRRRPLQVIAALAAIPQPRMELQPARSAGKRWLRALQSPELRVSYERCRRERGNDKHTAANVRAVLERASWNSPVRARSVPAASV